MRPPLLLAALLILATAGLADPLEQPTPAAPERPPSADPALEARLEALGRRNIRVHDPSTILPSNGSHWLFSTGRGIRSFHSKDLATWEAGPAVFTEPPGWTAEAVPDNRGGLDFWAPDVIRVDGRYLLYYSMSSFGRNTSAIGLATNATLDPADPQYRWVDAGPVIQSRRGDNFNAIDRVRLFPAVSFWPILTNTGPNHYWRAWF